MKFKKKIQLFFKKIFQIMFMLFYGKVNYVENTKDSKNITKKKIENIFSDMDETKDYFSYKIVNGRIYTDYVEQVAVIDGNNLVSDVSFQQILGELKGAKHNIVLTKGTPRIKKKIKGRVLSLVQGASGNNYYHWMFDILPKMKLCSEHYPLKEINYFYASSLQDFQRQTLPMLDIDE